MNYKLPRKINLFFCCCMLNFKIVILQKLNIDEYNLIIYSGEI